MKRYSLAIANLIISEVRIQFQRECEQNPSFPLWFVALAEHRSYMLPDFFDGHGKIGLFALTEQTFREVVSVIVLNDCKSIFDPKTNTQVLVRYVKWMMDRCFNEKFATDEGLLMAFLSLDAGYFRIKRIISECAVPGSIDQVLHMLPNSQVADNIAEIAKRYWELRLDFKIS